MSLNHLVERLSVKRDYVPPIGFVDDFFDAEAHHNLQRTTQSQIGIEIKPNTIQKLRIRAARWRSKKPQSIKAWRENNREKYNAYQLQWLDKNRDLVRERQRKRNAERYQNDAEFKQKKLEKNRRIYHEWKVRQIAIHGLEGFKAIIRQRNLKQKEKKQNEQRV